MRYLKITFVRVVLSFFAANMVSALIETNIGNRSLFIIFKIIFMGVFYYGLILYVNNRR